MALLDLGTIGNRSDSISVASFSTVAVQVVIIDGTPLSVGTVSVDQSIDGENWTATGTTISSPTGLTKTVDAKNAKFFSIRVTIADVGASADFLISGAPLSNIPSIPGAFILDTGAIGNTLGLESSVHVGKFNQVAIQSIPQGSAGAEVVVLTESLDKVNFEDSAGVTFIEDGMTVDIDVSGVNWLNVRVTTAGTINLKLLLIGEPH